MAFWAASAVAAPAPARASAGPARPLSYVLSAGPNSLLDHASLVRLRVDVPAAAAALAAAAEGADDEESALQQAEDAACAVGKLHQVIIGIEQAAEDAKVASVLEVLQDKTLQLLCSKAHVAKVYKSLLPHQAAAGCSMAPAKACLSQKAVAAWDLQESLQTAAIKTLTGCSSGTTAANSSSLLAAGGSDTAGAGPAQGWMCLSRHKLLGANLLAAEPGQLSTAPFVELEVTHDAGHKGLLLVVHAAGSVRCRLFSPTQALQQDPKSLKAPLTLTDTDADLLTHPAKLATAARQLEGRAVKLLPDERLVFIKGLAAAPTDPSQLQRMAQYWLGCYGLLLPPAFPFLVGVATHPEAEAAQMQVPSCCVLTNLGLATLPGSHAGGSCHAAAVSRLLSDLQQGAAGYTFWGNRLSVQGKDGTRTGVGLSQTNLQLTQGGKPAGTQQPAPASPSAAAAAVQAKAYSLQTQWTSATELSKLQAQASTQQPKQQQQQRELTAAEAQLMGLVEAEGRLGGAADGSTQGETRQRQPAGAGSNSSSADKQKWQSLRAYLAERDKQQQQQHKPASAAGKGGTAGIAAPAAAAAAAAGPSAAGFSSAPRVAGAGSSAARGMSQGAAAAACGVPKAPSFGSRKPGASKPAAAAKKPAAAAAAAAGARAAAGGAPLQTTEQQVSAAAGAAADGNAAAAGLKPAVPAGPPKAPALGKRPPAAAPAAAGKPPAPKKPKATAAAGAGAAGAATAGTKAKATKKPAKAPAAAAAAAAAAGAPEAAAAGEPGATAAAAAAAAEGPGGSQPAAEQQQQRKRTKASDLDLAAVSAKVQGVFAASGGTALKGVSVPEMQCYLRAQGVKGGSAKRADVEARLLGLLAAGGQQLRLAGGG